MSKKLLKSLQLASEQNDNAKTWMSELHVENDLYSKSIFAYVSIVIEHHQSIIELTNVRQSSALCLVRPLYEAYLRATWISLLKGSSKVDKTVKKLIELNGDDNFPPLKTMCEEIDVKLSELNKAENTLVFSKDLDNNKKLLHSYTHGGTYLVSIILNNSDKFTYEDMITILNSTTFQLLGSISAYATNIHNLDLFNKVSNEMVRFNDNQK